MSLLEQAEELLARRDCVAALAAFDGAEQAGADSDRCAGGRWMAQMLLGDYAAAWRESDTIRARGAADAHRFWQGEAIDGQRVMVRCLRGYGDTVMYLRWLPELRRRCRDVVVQVCPEMLGLIEAVVAGSEFSETYLCPARVVGWTVAGSSDRAMWDVQVESAELPYLFRATTASLPAPARFQFPEEELHRIRRRLGQRTKPRVGLVWTGSRYDPERSVPFAALQPLLQNHGVEFWSLQARWDDAEWQGYCAEQGWGERSCTVPVAGEQADKGLAAMAAFTSEMDLVITIDTMAAHVAGSLGLPTWVLLKREADWRWMLDREDSPWYPTMRLFRQSVSGMWDAPVLGVLRCFAGLARAMLC